jgi:hypothetical protein
MAYLHDDAHAAYEAYLSGTQYSGDPTLLSRISGKTRFIDHTRGNDSHFQFSMLPGVGQLEFDYNSVAPPLALSNGGDLHPSVVEYLNGLGLIGQLDTI